MASPTPSQTENNDISSISSPTLSDPPLTTGPKNCTICHESFQQPRVLSCLHTFCLKCIDKFADDSTRINCPECKEECTIPVCGASGLKPDFSISHNGDSNTSESLKILHCTGCKNLDSNAIARCVDCPSTLCDQCVKAHQIMHCFEGHRISNLNQPQISSKISPETYCSQHIGESLTLFCRNCSIPVCSECFKFEHQLHNCDFISVEFQNEVETLQDLSQQAKEKAIDLRNDSKGVKQSMTKLQSQYKKAKDDINDTYNFYRNILDGRRDETLKELEIVHNQKRQSLDSTIDRMNNVTHKLDQATDYVDRLIKCANLVEILSLKKPVESRLQSLCHFTSDIINGVADLEFISNFQAIQVGVHNTFGYIRQMAADPMQRNMQPPISKPPISRVIAPPNSSNSIHSLRFNGNSNNNNGDSRILNSLLPNDNSLGLTQHYGNSSSIGPTSNSHENINCLVNSLNYLHENLDNHNNSSPYERWSIGNDLPSINSRFSPTSVMVNHQQVQNNQQGLSDPMIDMTSKLITANIYPPRSQIKRHKMIYHCKFGEFGVMDGQFTEPSGVAVNDQNDIIVADTNNHRIQIFDREGRFKFQFGECGKRDGQLLYPNRVAVVKSSGDIVVTERSPTHQIQIYNQYGQFMRKFGASVLQHPRGVTVDSKGRIVIVECKVMRVIIFDLMGNVLRKFSCSKYLEFPNGVVVNDQDEIFISDNRAHCVKVFDYNGMYLRQVGNEGVTNYPIGVGINSNGEILIADNHNNFNITIFGQDGSFVNALESKVKHAQCFDVALMNDGSVVLASKDYRLYIYRYSQIPTALA